MRVSQFIAIALASIIGIMSVISGSLVLLGLRTVDYRVLNWLVVYNVILGIISIIASFLIWKNFTLSKKLISIILSFHIIIVIYLYFFNKMVSVESIKAMIFRVSIWILIFILVRLKLFKKINSPKNEKL